MVTTETRASSELSLRLTKAQELIDGGKGQRALDELWKAEALARGDADLLRRISALASSLKDRVEPTQASRLAELLEVLRHDAEATSRPPVVSRPVREDSRRSSDAPAFYFGLALSLLVAAAVSGLALLVWGIHTSNPCPCTGDFCIFGNPAVGGADAHLASASAGLLDAGMGIGLLVASGYLIWRFRTRLSHPLLSLVVGFPVLYVCLLMSIWAVARMVWGPTRCSA